MGKSNKETSKERDVQSSNVVSTMASTGGPTQFAQQKLSLIRSGSNHLPTIKEAIPSAGRIRRPPLEIAAIDHSRAKKKL